MKPSSRVLVALSGGVDSSVAAALLLEQGYRVEAAFMKNWSLPISSENDGCGWQVDFADAQAVADHLGIRLHFFDFEAEYQRQVIEPFFADYAAGLTPNPDVVCNRAIKFGLFLDRAREMGFDLISTGHYARRAREGKSEKAKGKISIWRGRDRLKDQSYFLWAAKADALAQTIFPIGELTKSEVRTKAKEMELPTAEKKDSQGICFVGPVNLIEFLKTRLSVEIGPVRSIETGAIVGEHEGTWFYTIGQRHSVGIFGGGLPYYVAEKDLEANTLWVASGRDHEALFQNDFIITDTNWLAEPSEALAKESKLSVQIRYRHPPIPCWLTVTGQSLQVTLVHPALAVTPGQSAVLYEGDRLLGGGVIAQSEHRLTSSTRQQYDRLTIRAS